MGPPIKIGEEKGEEKMTSHAIAWKKKK